MSFLTTRKIIFPKLYKPVNSKHIINTNNKGTKNFCTIINQWKILIMNKWLTCGFIQSLCRGKSAVRLGR